MLQKAIEVDGSFAAAPAIRGWTLVMLRRYDEAVCIMAGREEEARAAAKEALRVNPKFSVERYVKTYPLKDPAALERFAQALRKAGMPD